MTPPGAGIPSPWYPRLAYGSWGCRVFAPTQLLLDLEALSVLRDVPSDAVLCLVYLPGEISLPDSVWHVLEAPVPALAAAYTTTGAVQVTDMGVEITAGAEEPLKLYELGALRLLVVIEPCEDPANTPYVVQGVVEEVLYGSD